MKAYINQRDISWMESSKRKYYDALTMFRKQKEETGKERLKKSMGRKLERGIESFKKLTFPNKIPYLNYNMGSAFYSIFEICGNCLETQQNIFLFESFKRWNVYQV